MPDYPQHYYRNGINLFLCKYRLSENPKIAGIKHLNRLDQVIARAEWADEFQEGVTLDSQENVVEGTMTNLFIQSGEQLRTPTLERCGVQGIMRDYIMQIADGFFQSCKETDITLQQLKQADAIFMCNSVIGIWPVQNFESTKYKVTDQIIGIMQHINNHLSSLYKL